MNEEGKVNKTVGYLRKCGTFFLATIDGDQPRVRPFGAIMEYHGRVYINTNNTKKVYKQMMANPRVELSGVFSSEGNTHWIRVTGEVAVDDNVETRAAFLEACPGLKSMYKADDGIFEALYFTKGTATIYGFGSEPEFFEIYPA
jgi:uncharacterized pyridoxamine 5'-phosphate oxidase family protein